MEVLNRLISAHFTQATDMENRILRKPQKNVGGAVGAMWPA